MPRNLWLSVGSMASTQPTCFRGRNMEKKREMTEARRKVMSAALRKRRTETLPAQGLKEFVVVCPINRIKDLRTFAALLVAEEAAKALYQRTE